MSFILYYVVHAPRQWLKDLVPRYRRKLKMVEDWYYFTIKDDFLYRYPSDALATDVNNTLRYARYVTGDMEKVPIIPPGPDNRRELNV